MAEHPSQPRKWSFCVAVPSEQFCRDEDLVDESVAIFMQRKKRGSLEDSRVASNSWQFSHQETIKRHRGFGEEN